MTLREFLTNKQVTALEMTDDLVFNLICENEIFALDIDTSNVMGGTILKKETVFTITDDELIVGSISLNLDNTTLLSYKEEIV
jgi:hypothetical protein